MNETAREEIKRVLDKNFSDQKEFLRDLTRAKSANPFTPENSVPDAEIELGTAKLIKGKLEEFGLSSEFKGVSPSRPNVVCGIGSGAGKTLILNGHMDTILPPEDYGSDPYGGEIKEGKLFGVGSADMKASLAAFVFTAKALVELGIELRGNLILAFTVDEEPGAFSDFGAKHLLENGLKGDAAIVAEPGSKSINIAQRGGYRFKITTFGKSLHTGTSAWEKLPAGQNAVSAMAKIIDALIDMEIPYSPAENFPHRGTVFAFPTILKAGQSINVLPGKCEAWGDSRLLPGNSAEQVKALIKERLEKIKGIDYELKDILSVPPVEISKDEEIVKILSKRAEDVLGFSPKTRGAGPWSDAWMFIEKGIPAICGFGPDGENVHSKGEFVYLDSLRKMTEVYLLAAVDFIGLKN